MTIFTNQQIVGLININVFKTPSLGSHIYKINFRGANHC